MTRGPGPADLNVRPGRRRRRRRPQLVNREWWGQYGADVFMVSMAVFLGIWLWVALSISVNT